MFKDHVGMDTCLSVEMFHLIDGHHFGKGEGSLWLGRLQDVVGALPVLTEDEEAADPVGQAFASFLEPTCIVEQLSFRSSAIGRVEIQCIATQLRITAHLRALNLYGNDVGDPGAKLLGEALAQSYSLEWLSLARNWVTHAGLEKLVMHLGHVRVEEKAIADQLTRSIKDAFKERDKKNKNPTPPKVDGNGRQRHFVDFHVDTLEELKSAAVPTWLHGRNCSLKVLNLEQNLVADADVVQQLLSGGSGQLVLRGNPCVEQLLEAERAREAMLAERQEENDDAEERPTSQANTSKPQPEGSFAKWELVLQ